MMSNVKVDDDRPDVLSPIEVESYVEAIEKSLVKDLGSLGWLEKHERMKQLAIQSVIQALSNREETVKESLLTHEKLPLLVHEVILIELWREHVLPQLLQEGEELTTGFCIYPILYHESSVINLLETVLYHSAAAEGLGDASLDLVDYCLRSMNYLIMSDFECDFGDDGETPSKSGGGDRNTLAQQSESLLMGIALKALTTLRYIIENIDQLGNGLISRLVVSTDTPMLLVELLVQKPWRREYWQEGKTLDFSPTDLKWKEIDPSTRHLLSPSEIQVWLALFLLLKNNSILSSYEIYESRKNHLLKLRPYLNDLTLDQVPILGELQLFLNQLAVTSGPFGPSKSPLLLEMVPPIRDALEEEFKNNKRLIVEDCRKELFGGDKGTMLAKARRLASAYDFSSFEAALPIVKQCAKCGKSAEKKCSKCKQVWYCGRECQVSHWEAHKPNCET